MLLRRVFLLVAALLILLNATVAADWRNIQNGFEIPDEGYCDQPYVVATRDGNWLCVLTTGAGHEGQQGQHVVSTISADRGRTWSAPVDIEPADGPEASWAVPLVTPGGRVYVFYDYNGDRISTLNGKPIRADMLGWYVYKYSDDNGKTWSRERYRIPIRETACDRTNDWQGQVQIFWGICKPQVDNDAVLFSFTKLGRYMLDQGEGWALRSPNLLTETEPAKIEWKLLPDGEHGIRGPRFGSVQEEHNIVPLGNDRWCCIYRTTQGHACESYSRDGGHTWSSPQPVQYANGRTLKHNRACPKVWRTSNGKYLLWFHNHGGKSFADRNPAWLTAGHERDGRLVWSEPEILFYDPDPSTRMSYPDLIEQDGRYWITETQKSVARVHKVEAALLEGLWNQHEAKSLALDALIVSAEADELENGVALPRTIDLSAVPGLALELWLTLDSAEPGQTILDGRDESGRGLALQTAEDGALAIEVADGSGTFTLTSDPQTLRAGQPQHLVVNFDAGPQIATMIVDGRLCDGGDAHVRGWERWEQPLGDISGGGQLRVPAELQGTVDRLRLHIRPLTTSEAVAGYRATVGTL